MIDVNWFKSSIKPNLENYEIEYRYFENGDFGALNQVEFNSKELGGEIDFWSSGWIGIFLVDYTKEEVILNYLIEPDKNTMKEDVLKKLLNLL